MDARTGALLDEESRRVVVLRDGFLAPLDEMDGLRFLGAAEEEEVVDEGRTAGVGGRGAIVVFLSGEEAEGRCRWLRGDRVGLAVLLGFGTMGVDCMSVGGVGVVGVGVGAVGEEEEEEVRTRFGSDFDSVSTFFFLDKGDDDDE